MLTDAIEALEDACELMREARLRLSDAGIDAHHASVGGGSTRREIVQVQSHLQLAIIHTNDIAEEWRELRGNPDREDGVETG
jgi:hypothetical protein